MIIDNKGRLFSKINVLDICVILLVLGLLATLIYKASSKETLTIINSNKKFYVTFVAERVREYSVDAVNEGDVFYERYQQVLGKVVKKETREAYDILKKDDGTASYAPVEDKWNLYTTIECSGNVNDGGYYVNGNRQISVGNDIEIKSNMAVSNVRVYHISETLE